MAQIQTREAPERKWPKKLRKKLGRLVREWVIAKARAVDPGELEEIRKRLFRETLYLMHEAAAARNFPARAGERTTRL